MKLFSLIRRPFTPLVVLCCFVFFGGQPAPAQVAVAKTDPGHNNPPPAGPILDLSGSPIPGGGDGTYQKYTVNFTATLTHTAITLAFRDDPAQVFVANTSVMDVTIPSAPSGNLLVNGDFSGAVITSNGNPFTPFGWTYANVFGAFAGGGASADCGVGGTGTFCWFDGAVQAFDAISQTIPTTIGDTYQITFFVAEDSAIFATPGSHGGLFPATFPGSDCYLAAGHGGPSPCTFSGISTNGDTTDPAGNGIDVTVYAQAGLPAAQTIYSEDPNFTASLLASGLSGPSGLVFRPPTGDFTGDLVVSQFSAGVVSRVNATSGAISTFASQTAPVEVAVRSSDGVVAVKTGSVGQVAGPIDFYSSTGTTSLGSIAAGTPNGCITGLAFDGSGNLFVAAGPGTVVPGGCQTSGWAIYKFAGPTPWTATPSQVVTFNAGDLIEGLAFSAAPLPSGSLYAVSSTNGNIYQIPLATTNTFTTIAIVPTTTNDSGNPVPGISGIAVDPLVGDIYISEFNGRNILRMPPPQSDPPPTIFATGFTNSFGLSFDTNGNLYVNETNTGKIWKFTRASHAAPAQTVIQGQQNTVTFANPNATDQTQTIMIPASANLGGTATIQDIFVQVNPATLNARLSLGSSGDTAHFGGGPVPRGTTCVQVPSANNNCLVIIQKCYDANGNLFAICPVQEPAGSSDLILLTIPYTGPLVNPAFLIDYDTPPNNNTLTNITTNDCCGGGSKGLCSQTFLANFPAPDFFLGLVSPITVSVGSTASTTVTVNPIGSFISTVSLSQSGLPAALSPTFNPTSGTPLFSSMLTVGGPAATPGTFLATVTGTSGLLTHSTPTSVTVSTATTSGIANVIASLLNGGCIVMDNDDRGDDSVHRGVANALIHKLSEAQEAINAGHSQTAINILTAFKKQVQAQSGKHIATSCMIGGITFSPATVLLTDAQSLIDSLRTDLIADPITGYVLNSSGLGVSGATVSIVDSTSDTEATATSDITGFYFFPTTGVLASGKSYTVKVTLPVGTFTSSTPPSQTFMWTGTTGMVLNNFVLNP